MKSIPQNSDLYGRYSRQSPINAPTQDANCNILRRSMLKRHMRHHFEAKQWLPYDLSLVFAFFANPQNLPPLMPDWQQARIEEVFFVAPPPPPPGSPARIATGAGTTMTLSFRALPLVPFRIRWYALIPEFAWNDHFCDEQTAGPFRYWRHCHRVYPEMRNGQAGTVVHDRVEYELPGGRLGDLANWVAGRWNMRYIFKLRQQKTERLMADYARRQARRNPTAGGS